MKYCVSVFAVFVALKSVYSSITSNLSACSNSDVKSKDCLATNAEVGFKNLENYNPDLEINILDSIITNSVNVEPSSGPLNAEQMMTFKLREHSCAKASEYILENNCRVFAETNISQISLDAEEIVHKNKTTPVDRESDNSLATTAIYLYGWLAYRLVFVFLQQM